ncbi:hypothetical protein BS78_03G225400 [Paspalum vaginatum]|nr:hypothetical protein BS78_03G225400 [Paspalum vaginatum]
MPVIRIVNRCLLVTSYLSFLITNSFVMLYWFSWAFVHEKSRIIGNISLVFIPCGYALLLGCLFARLEVGKCGLAGCQLHCPVRYGDSDVYLYHGLLTRQLVR